VALSIEIWIFIAYFFIIIGTLIILRIYIKKDYIKILLSIIILAFLIPFNLIVQEPFLNFISLVIIVSNLIVSLLIIFRPLFLIKEEKAIFLEAKSELDENLKGDIQGTDD